MPMWLPPKIRRRAQVHRCEPSAHCDKELAGLQAQHRPEWIDRAWESRTDGALGDIAASKAFVSTELAPCNYKAECPSATCRITDNFAPVGDAQDWGTFFLTGSGDQFRHAKAMVVPVPDGSAEVRAFGARRFEQPAARKSAY